jgi:Trypsin-like peptidase domain
MGKGAIIVMHRLVYFALILLVLVPVQSRGETACIDSALLAYSTVGITRYFDDAERAAQPDLLGIQGTGWFRSPTSLVTVEHVVAAMGLSTEEWKVLTIQDVAESHSIGVRIQRVAGAGPEKLVVLELQTAISTARSVPIRMSPLVPDDRIVTMAYPNRQRRAVTGRFVQYATDGKLAGTGLLEIYEGNNRLVIDHGASGAPVFDCEGRIAAVISTVITQIFRTPFGEQRISTAWGTPNVVSVPIRELVGSLESQ